MRQILIRTNDPKDGAAGQYGDAYETRSEGDFGASHISGILQVLAAMCDLETAAALSLAILACADIERRQGASVQ